MNIQSRLPSSEVFRKIRDNAPYPTLVGDLAWMTHDEKIAHLQIQIETAQRAQRVWENRAQMEMELADQAERREAVLKARLHFCEVEMTKAGIEFPWKVSQ